MIKINLLPSRIIEQRKRRDFIIFVGMCAVLASLLCYFSYLSFNKSIYPMENKLKRLESEIARHQPLLKEIQRIKEKNDKLRARFNAFKEVVIRQSFWPRLLYSIYRSLPDTLWLEEIKGSSGQNFIEIKGRSLNKTIGVADFIKNMEDSKFFSQIKFSKFSKQELFGREIMFFHLKCFLSGEIEGG